MGLALALREDVRALSGRRTAELAVATLPAVAAGYLAHGAVERRLGRPGPTAALMAGAGLLLLFADRSRQERPVEPRDVAVAGLAQVPALAPGVSRAGSTLTALRARGVDRDEAVRLSLLLSLPVTAGAAVLTVVRGREAPPLVPTALAAATSYAVARRVRPTRAWVVSSVVYRLGIAAAVAARLSREQS